MRDVETHRFAHLEDNQMNIARALMDNQDLLKWMIYLEYDYPLEQKDVPKRGLIGEYIRFEKFYEDALYDKKAMIFISPYRANYSIKRSVVRDLYEVNIVVPNELSYNYDTLTSRSSKIAEEVVKTLDQQDIAGIGRMWLQEFYYVRATKNHNGWNLIFNISSSGYRSNS